jgi:putative ABC transport system permease protein
VRPPAFACWLLERALNREAAEAIVGDLTEGYRERAATASLGARVWFWRQTIASIVVARFARWRPAVPVDPGAAGRAGLIAGIRQDLRYTLRVLRRSPAFAVAAIATLAIGIGASTAIGTAADRALLRPLPYATGERLVFLGHPNPDGSVGNVGFATVPDWRARITTFDTLSIIRGWSPTLVAPEGAAPVTGMKVSWNFFQMLGVRPAMGRDFAESDDDPQHWRVVIITDATWRQRFHARPDIIGSTIEFNTRQFQIVGVLPASFDPLVAEHFFGDVEMWAPLGYNLTGDSSCRSCQHLRLLGRLREGATLDQARAQAASVHADLRREHPQDYTEAPPAAVMLQDEIARPMRRPLQVLLGAVVFVLLVASTNVAGLLMARAAGREREFALRAALGAGWGRLIRQLMTESVVLAVAAAALGLLLARWGLVALAEYAPTSLPRIDRAPADPALVLLALITTAVALVAFGLLPALLAGRPNLDSVLRSSRHSATRHSLRTREWLMAGQVAVALVLVSGAGLMHRTVDRLLSVDPGFDARNVMSTGLSLVGPAWAEDSAVRAFQENLLPQVRALPGVERAALAGQIPLGGNYDRWGFHIEGRTYSSDAEAPEVERYSVTPGYFETMRIPLKQGRLFTDADVTDGDPVLLINETAARTLWPGADPIGAHVRIGSNTGKYRTIVGVVGDVRHYALGQPPTLQMYAPQRQMTDSYLVLVARVSNNAAALAQPIRHVVTGLARDVPVYDVATLEQRLDRSVASRTFLMSLLALFALATLVMAAVGLYGVVAQGVGARHREFGIRLALGAARRDITWLAARRGCWLVAGGVLAGAMASTLAGRLLSGQLYQTTPADPLVLAVAAAMLLVVAFAAHVGPIRRALSVDPAVTLRND